MDTTQIKKLKDKVAYCLEHDEQSRNSDVRLTVYLWAVFYNDAILTDDRGQRHVKLSMLFDIPREDHVTRVRRQIQNDEQKFPPTSWGVARQRGWLQDEWREAMGYPRKTPENQLTLA